MIHQKIEPDIVTKFTNFSQKRCDVVTGGTKVVGLLSDSSGCSSELLFSAMK